MNDFISAPVSLLDQEYKLGATPDIRSVVDDLARTEDARFTSDGRRLAIAGFARGSIMILELSAPPELAVIGTLSLQHDRIQEPHGLDWIGTDTLAAANRSGRVEILSVPPAAAGQRSQRAEICTTIRKIGFRRPIHTPGSLAVTPDGAGHGLWVCNNYANLISYHRLRKTWRGLRATGNRIALESKIRVPDGITISDDGRFMGISNHDKHQVLIYRILRPGKAERIGQLERIDYPHGLRFLPGGTEMIVADAGQPFLHVFRTENDWQGDHLPVRQVRVMDDATYLRGRHNPQEGGIKGIDIDVNRGLVATTCEMQTLKFYRLADVMGNA